MAKSKRASIHYVNNAEFSQAVVTYVKSSNQAKEAEKQSRSYLTILRIVFFGSQRVFHTSLTSFDTHIEKKWLWMQSRTA